FAALERAASTAQWHADAASRLIIWIGDQGNRRPGKYVTPAGELIETKTAQSVIDAIRQADARLRADSSLPTTKTRFVAIQVQGTSKSRAERSQFLKDAASIQHGLGESVFKTIPARRGQDSAVLTDSIIRQVGIATNAIREARAMVSGTLGGE